MGVAADDAGVHGGVMFRGGRRTAEGVRSGGRSVPLRQLEMRCDGDPAANGVLLQSYKVVGLETLNAGWVSAEAGFALGDSPLTRLSTFASTDYTGTVPLR